ncbi:solute carrier organic anion transporter family member 4C1-like [Diadema setosum]|uniref:solute carrier organic anion transporter family member 4C1-like n=1 Tax=Diadema setosum TaxID=31175 RepID=UPI003B3AB1AC
MDDGHIAEVGSNNPVKTLDETRRDGQKCNAVLDEADIDVDTRDLSCDAQRQIYRCLQHHDHGITNPFFQRPASFLFLQGMFVTGLIPSSLTSLERRFQLSSQQTGLLYSIYDIVNVVLVVFVAYIGGRGHKLRWMSFGCILVGVASFLFALPHFTTEAYSYADLETGSVCRINSNGTNDQCVETDEGSKVKALSNYYYLFVVAMLIASVGSVPYFSLGIPTLDESVSDANFGVYFGIFYAFYFLGPAVGYFLSGVFLDMFTELEIPEGTNLSPEDPGWVGAWWIGFLVCGVPMVIVAILLSLFPSELPTTAAIRAEKSNQSHRNSGFLETTQPGFGEKPGDFPKAVRYLLVNPTFVFTCLSGVSDAFFGNAVGAFLPKLYVNQFGTSTSMANVFAGIAVLVGGISGAAIGGILMRRLELKVRGLLKMTLAGNFVTCMFVICAMLYCPQGRIAGVTAPYNGTERAPSFDVNLTQACNQNCQCAVDEYIPVCAQTENGPIEYFSPCHAGCSLDTGNGVRVNGLHDPKHWGEKPMGIGQGRPSGPTFGDCSCLRYAGSSPWVPDGLTTVSGRCQTPRDCSYYPHIVTFLFIFIAIATFSSFVSTIKVLLSCVPETQRSMSLGLNSLISRLLGAIPGPIIFGAVIDGACLVWQQTCGTRGSCWIYDTRSLALRLAAITLVSRIFSCLCNILAMVLYKPTT